MKSGKRLNSKQSVWKTRVLVLLLVLLAAGGGAAWYFLIGPGAVQAKASAQREPETYTTPVIRGDLQIAAAGSGKLVAYQSIDMSFSTSGTVTELNVKLGDTVKAGQVLASLGNAETLEANLAEAKLQVIQAQNALSDLQSNADLSLAQAYSDLVAAQETYTAAQTKSQRLAYAKCSQDAMTRLADTLKKTADRLANLKVETKESNVYITAKQAYDTALANYNNCAPYTTAEKASIQSALDVAQNALNEAQEQYDTLKAASGIDPNALAMDEANLKKAQAQQSQAEETLSGITLTAPFDGKITYLAAEKGALIGTTKFLTLVDTSHAMLDITVDESDMEKLIIGSNVAVTFDALPDQTFSGTVTQIDPEITRSGEYRVAKAEVQLADSSVKTISMLPLGLSATVTVINQEAKDALLAPVVALKDLGDGTYAVMVKGSDGKMRMQVVSVGIKGSDYAEITSGLNEGEMVSTGSVNFVAAGSSSSSSSLKNAQNDNGMPGMPPGGMP